MEPPSRYIGVHLPHIWQCRLHPSAEGNTSHRLGRCGRTSVKMETIQKKTTRTTTTTSTETSGEVQTKSSTTTSAEMTSHKTVSITRKGQFFDDSFFEDTRQDYQDAIKDVLTKWGDKSSKTDDMTSYRQLRTRDMRDENMAVKSSDDELFHKVQQHIYRYC